MGLFSEVEMPAALLPAEVRHLTRWQTKDVIEPAMKTLRVTEDGDLFCEWWDVVVAIPDPDSPIGWRVERRGKHSERLDYTGDMLFYTGSEPDPNRETWGLIECLAHFDGGKLQGIDYLGPWKVQEAGCAAK